MKTFIFSIGLMTGIMGLSVEADAAGTHVLGAKQQTLATGTDTVNAGYYSATTLSAVDADLAAGNIKSGVTIFGKLGTYTTGYALPDTGQTGDYVARFGEDSDYASPVNQPNYTIQNPVGISSVTIDNRTGLMWVTNPVDAAISGTYLWEDAIDACEGLIGSAGTYAGYNDWRLPNIRELMSIVDYQNVSPAINTAYFLNPVGAFYWSSTSYVQDNLFAWEVGFVSGIVNLDFKTSSYSVRCVRAGPGMED
ncbi:MAG: DUF1566 domain-containing protein [Elusimicrobiota bacterium]|nr:DUF1566 domain-containing protein [Elusimicrobiota bacterium]